MARKKSAEELAIEAELAAAAESQKELQAKSASEAKQAKRQASDQIEKLTAQSREAQEAKPVDAAAVEAELPKQENKLAQWLTKGRIAAIVAAVVVVAVVAVIAFNVSFANSYDVWDGTSDTSWYPEEKVGTPGFETTIKFTEAEQLAGLRDLCNDGKSVKGITFELGRNLDLYDQPTKPIGDGFNDGGTYHRFDGNFDGAGHTVRGINIQIDDAVYDCAGLFGTADDGFIRDLTVEGKVTGQVRVGGVVGEASGTNIENCTNRCQVSSLKTATSYYPVQADVGGVVGIYLAILDNDKEQEGYLRNLVNEGDVSARACSAGGVVGTIANTDNFELEVENLSNSGKVTVYCDSEKRDEGVGGAVGGIGSLGNTTIGNVVNEGEVVCSTVCNVGGVFGVIEAPQATQNDDGTWSKGVRISSCKNTAPVTVNASPEVAHLAGIAGYVDDPETVFENCENTGELKATNGNVDEINATNGAEVWEAWEDAHPETYFN